MSTRCEIGKVLRNGSVQAVYNHFDGYLSGVGLDLLTDWNSEDKATEVVNGAYNREEERHFQSVDDWLKHLTNSDREYAYLWKDGHWQYIKAVWNNGTTVWSTEWQDVSEGLKTE